MSKKPQKLTESGLVQKITTKSTNAELNQRVSEVQQLQLEGRTRSYILQYGSKWNVSVRQIDDYISHATTITKEVNLATLQDNTGVIINNLWTLYRTANSSGDIKNAHSVLMSIAKIKGLDQQTINHIIEDKRDLEDLSDSDLDDILSTADKYN